MRPVKIVTDSCSDLPKELREKYDIDYMMMNTVKDGKETPASLDWAFYSPKDFYDSLREGERTTTTMVPPSEFQKYFRAELEKGNDIVYIACSSKLSGSVNVGKVEAENILKDYPGAVICCVDAINACVGEGIIAIKAAGFRDEGKTAKEIEAALLPIRNNVNQFVTVHTLNMLKAAGRVSGSSAFMGNLLGVKPIIISDKAGNNIPIKKVKGRLNSLKEIVALTAEAVEGIDHPDVYVAHADCEEDALYLIEQLNAKKPPREILSVVYEPVTGSHVGPGTLALFFLGDNTVRFR